MELALDQHQVEIQRNRLSWDRKPLLGKIYDSFYKSIASLIDPSLPGSIVALGSGIGLLKQHFPEAITTDLFLNPLLDLVCDGYELPFATQSVSHLVLFDVFHHLETPKAFLQEARRVLAPSGRIILFEPYISCTSMVVYGLLHHEPVAWNHPIARNTGPAHSRRYYAAQGNA